MSKIKIIPENPVLWLKFAFWTGAIIDAKAFFFFLFPSFLPSVTKSIFNMDIPDVNCQESVWLRFLVALFDLGWTILLIWAAIKPLERKGIMLFTIFPIITGILILRFIITFNATVSPTYIITNVIFVILFFFFTYSYLINCIWFTKKVRLK